MKFDYIYLQEANNDELLQQYNLLQEFRKKNSLINFDKWSTSRHHFLPKCMGGDNSKDNYIRITNEEHFVAHYILHKLYGGKMTSAFNILCGGLIKLESKKSLTNLKEIKSLFESETYTIRQLLSKTMKGNKNPSFGLFGKSHPTSSFDKSGSNNPRFGIKCPENVKMSASKSNKGMVSAKDKQSGKLIWVEKIIFDTNDNLVGVSANISQPKLKNTVCCFDMHKKCFIRVTSKEFKENSERYVGLGSKIVKEFKRNNK